MPAAPASSRRTYSTDLTQGPITRTLALFA